MSPDVAHADRIGETLVDCQWLWDRRDSPEVLAVGASNEGFVLGHVPGVVLPIHPWLKDTPPGTPIGTRAVPADQFGEAMERIGVTEHTTVVVYDDFDGSLAARLWWVLRYYGHDRVRVLDGGWHRWVIERFPLSDQERPHDIGHVIARPHSEMMCATDDLLERRRNGKTTVVDVRTRDEWQGSDPNYWGHRRQGRIPGSVHLEPLAPFNEDSHTFRSANELRSVLDRTGVPEQGDVVFYCQVGVAAAVGVLVLYLLGRDGGLLYEASMVEWANRDDTPMERDLNP